MLALAAAVAVAGVLGGCDATTQTTSGQRYLERYPTGPGTAATAGASDVDRLVAEVAAVEPVLRFPARIGLARIDNGRLIDVPMDEGDAWFALREALGPAFGEFVPLNLVVAEMVYSGVRTPASGQSTLSETIAHIRLGAARQHLDAVLIYEIALETELRRTGFSILDWTIVGAYARTNRAHAQAYATALLVDVRNGYPYGTAVAAVEDDRPASTFGNDNRLARQSKGVTQRAVSNLTPEVEKVFRRLAEQLPASQTLARADS